MVGYFEDLLATAPERFRDDALALIRERLHAGKSASGGAQRLADAAAASWTAGCALPLRRTW